MFGPIELVGDEFPIPARDRVRLGDAGHLGQRLAPESLADFGQDGPLRIGQSQSRRQMGAQNAILSRQILGLKQQFLIDEAGDVREQP
jgi:hypothetical protein